MADFTLDTSGVVKVRPSAMPEPWKPGRWLWAWTDLSPLEQGYVEALFESLRPVEDSDIGFQQDLAFSDLAPETLAAIRKDCDLLCRKHFIPTDATYSGSEFWKRRQAGKCETLGFPPLTVTLGDDGRVYATPTSTRSEKD